MCICQNTQSRKKMNKLLIILIVLKIFQAKSNIIVKSAFTVKSKSNNGDVQFTVKNNCGIDIWPGFWTSDKNPPLNGGALLSSGQSVSFSLPTGISGRIWARTNCQNNGQFKCETGDCGASIECSGRTGEATASLAEFYLGRDSNQDFYDISLVDAFNVEVSMTPTNPSNADGYHCTLAACETDINSQCPEELKVSNSAGQVVSCLSACTKYHTDEYCCRGQYNNPNTCKATDTARFIKSLCPLAYSYAYDDNKSTFTCSNTGYNIQFC